MLIIQKKIRFRASYTVEAAVIIPVTVLVLAALLIASFYLHDRAVLQGSACETAAVGANALVRAEGYREMQRKKRETGPSGLMGSRLPACSASLSASGADVSWRAVYPVPGVTGAFFLQKNLPISTAWSQKIYHAPEIIRVFRGINTLTGGRNGMGGSR